MTPERKKYLDSCSSEELAIRDQIEYTKFQIWRIKGYLNADWRSKDKANEANAKKDLHSRQRAIKALKKQLPAKIKIRLRDVWEPESDYDMCPVCGEEIYINGLVWDYTYCPFCGQRLNKEE